MTRVIGTISELGNRAAHSLTRRLAARTAVIGSIGIDALSTFTPRLVPEGMAVNCLGCHREFSFDEYRRHRATSTHAGHGEAVR